jgi:ATP-binding cassette subfamily C (CFTR/MRP) protein 1
MYTAGPVVVALAAFSTYALLGHPLTAAVAFPSLALFNLLQFPIVMIPGGGGGKGRGQHVVQCVN